MKKALSILVCMLLLVSLLSGCSKEVAVDATGLVHMTLDGAATTMTEEGYTAKLVADTNYELPQTISVVMEGQEGAASFTYDPATGELSIPEVVGAITIKGEATESIVGTWKGSVDFSKIMTEMIAASDPSMASYFNFPAMNLDLVMTFSAEGVCTMSGDPDSTAALVDTMAKSMLDGMVLAIEDVLKQEGLDISFETFLALSGMSMEDLQKQLLAEIDTEDLLEGLENEGKYELADGLLYLSDDLNSEVDKDDGTPYTLVDGVLTIEAPTDLNNEAAALIFPLVLSRAN